MRAAYRPGNHDSYVDLVVAAAEWQGVLSKRASSFTATDAKIFFAHPFAPFAVSDSILADR